MRSLRGILSAMGCISITVRQSLCDKGLAGHAAALTFREQILPSRIAPPVPRELRRDHRHA
jgi:hypothetical protein